MKTKFMLAALLAAFLAVGLAPESLARAGDMPCPFAGQTMMLVARLYFGQSGADGKPVSGQAWRNFLAQMVTPRFPGGFTVYDAQGQWENPRTRITAREETKVIEIAAADTPETRSRIEEISRLYRRQFQQQSVGLVSHSACGRF